MVSLSPGFNTSSGGARYFNEGSNMDEDRMLEPILTSDKAVHFTGLKTIPVASVQIFVSLVISITGIVLALNWPEERRCEAYFIMLYMHAVFWLISFIIDHLVHYQHNALRMNGYLEFHRTTNVLHRLPLYVVSLWNAVLLCVQTIMEHFYSDTFADHCIKSITSPASYVAIFCIMETIVIVGINGRYIQHVHRFNRSQVPPDALKDDWHGGIPGAPGAQTGTVGYAQRGGHLAELLEKQADLIHYLKDHNSKLSQKLMQMNAQMRNNSHANM